MRLTFYSRRDEPCPLQLPGFLLPSQLESVLRDLVGREVRGHHEDCVLALDEFAFAICQPPLCTQKR